MGKINIDMPYEIRLSSEEADWNLLFPSKSISWWVDKKSIIREGDILYFKYSLIDHQPVDPLGKLSFINRLKAETSRKLGGDGNIFFKKINCKDKTVFKQKYRRRLDPDLNEITGIYYPPEWMPLWENYGYPLNEKIESLCNLN